MPNLLFYFCLSLLITWPTHHTSCKPIGSHRRRLLHQPFSPLDSLPPSEPPSPSPPLPPNPKYPFSASPSPPSNSPFFPSFSAPPPPPSPSTFATFPANISSLIIPHTSSAKPTSHKLVIAALTAVASAALVLAVIVFLFIRRKKNRNFSDDKTSRSGNSHRFFQANAETSNGTTTTTTTTHKLRSSSTSSEFLYLGTLVSSRRIDDRPDSRGNRGGKIVLDTRKLDSPELHPLPPLARQCSRLNCGSGDKGLINCGNRDVGSSVEDEDEFYSPRGSLEGRESSNGTGSGSRRIMETMVGESFVEGRSSSASSSSSYSSSSSRSPSRSHSISLSPPVSLSPRIPEFKSPECSMFQSPQPLPQQNVATSLVDQRSVSESASPERVLENIPVESPRLSKASKRNVRSPSLSPMSSSPDRDMERHSSALDRNLGSPSLYSLSLSPERGLEENPDALLPESAGSDLFGRASSLLSLSSLPERVLGKNPDTSPKVSVDLDGNGGSTSVSTLSSSPERGLGKNSDASSKVSVDLDRNGRSTANSSLFSSPERCLVKNPDASMRLWIVSDRSKHSDTPSLSSSSSPDRVIEGSIVRSSKASYSSDEKGKKFSAPSCLSSEIGFAKTSVVPLRNSNVFDRISFELDPNRQSFSSSSPSSDSDHNSDMSLRRSNKVSPVIMGSDLRQPLSIPILQHLPPSPPPLPPPSSRPRKHWAVPCPSTPVGPSSLPESYSEHNSDATPMTSNVLNQNVESRIRKHWEVPCSSTALEQSSSSESDSDHCSDASPRTTKVSDQNGESGVRIISDLKQPISVTPPPPPPPLPPPLPLSSQSQKHWAIPSPSTPVGQPISRPPALTAPSRPFVFQNPPKIDVSPVELPPSSEAMETVEETPKLKLKALHWDKVRASSDREMVWDQLRSSSFKLNEEMIETLFVFNTPYAKSKETTPRSAIPSPNTENRVLDPKKSQNISILLRALNVTIDEVCEALLEGNADALGTELLESLLKMAPTKEEERKLKEYKGDSPFKLGPAEKFLKALLDVPFAFRRVDAMLYISNFDSELEYLKKSYETLEAACEELRNSRMFLKLLEAVLKTGNRMNVGTNRGDAHAFKLDTLLKLADVKGADGKTTLLHFVVQEIIRTEGSRPSVANQVPNSTLSEDVKCRKLGLQVVSGLSSDLTNVKKAAAMDSDVLSNDVSKLSTGISDIEEVIKLNQALESDESRRKFSESMKKFMKMAEEEIIRIQAQESVAMSLVKEITEYFHGNSAKEEAHPFRIFTVVRDFLTVLDRVCKEVGMINERTIISSAHKFPVPINPTLPQVVAPALHEKRQYNSSDDDSP